MLDNFKVPGLFCQPFGHGKSYRTHDSSHFYIPITDHTNLVPTLRNKLIDLKCLRCKQPLIFIEIEEDLWFMAILKGGLKIKEWI